MGFAVGLKTVTDLAPLLNLPWKSWYLDDRTIVEPAKEVYAYLAHLADKLPAVGLHLNLNKCILYGPGIRKDREAFYPAG